MASTIEDATTNATTTAKHLRQARQARYRARTKLDLVKVKQKAQNQAKYKAKAKLKNEPETCILSVAGSNVIITQKTKLVNEQGNLRLLYLPKHYSECNKMNVTKAITDL